MDVFTFHHQGSLVKISTSKHLDYIEENIITNKSFYENEILLKLQYFLKSPGLVIDVGANLGNHTIFFSLICQRDVIAIEPLEKNIDKLKENISRNNLEQSVKVIQAAAGDKAGKIALKIQDDSNLGMAMVDENADGDIPLITLDSLTITEPVALLKIDVEGFEIPVLKGALELIKTNIPIICIEAATAEQYDAICYLLLPIGYSVVGAYNATPTFIFYPPQQNVTTELNLLKNSSAQLAKYYIEKFTTYTELCDRYKRYDLLHANNKELEAKYKKSIENSTELEAKYKKSIENSTELENKNKQSNEKNSELNKQNQDLNERNREIYNENIQIKKDSHLKTNKIKNLNVTQANLKQQLSKAHNKKRALNRKIKGLKQTEAWKVGYVTVKAFKEPGKNTLLWVPRLVKILLTSTKKLSTRATTDKTSSTATKNVCKKPTLVKKKPRSQTSDEIKKELSIIGIHSISQASEFRVFTILDDFSRLCFLPEFNIIQPRPDNWQALAEYWHPDLLFVESAWQGNEGSWQYRIGKYDAPPGRELQEMVAWFKAKGIPTVFWNKEDPVHYDKFIDAAKQFDIICTTDANRIPVYKKDTTIDNVTSLSFAAQPELHNPISIGQPRKAKACFAGTFYANRFSERQTEMEWLLDAAQKVGLDIFDRNFGMIGLEADHFKFPERLQKNIIGKLPYDALCRAYKEYKVFLNVNSVIDSPTMFSRRIYELLASGTPVVSTYSQGIENIFGTDLIWMVESEQDARNAIETLLTDEYVWKSRSIKGIREVFSSHTYAHRLQKIVALTGSHFQQCKDKQEKHVFFAGEAANQDEVEKLATALARQTIQNYTCLLFTDDPTIARTENKNVEIVTVNKKSMYLRDRLLSSGAHYFGTVSPASIYGKYYLEDLLNGYRYTSAAIVGKSATGKQFVYDSNLAAHGFIIQCSKLLKIGGLTKKYLSLDPIKLGQLGLGCFCIDNMNYKENYTHTFSNYSLKTVYKEIEL